MSEGAAKYRREMGTLGVVFLVVNGVIGAGIFALPELLHAAVGSFAPWLILAGAVLIGCVVVCFAALTGLTDRSGGPQRFVTDAFGSFPGFQIGWIFYFARMLAHAANVTVLVAYAAAFWPALGEGTLRSAAIVLVIGALTLLNIVGIRRVVAVLGAITLGKLVPLAALIGLALVEGPAMGPVVLPQFSAVEGVALAALYAFVGFENATIPAGEALDPKRTMPRALLISLAIVTLVYFGLQYAYSKSPVAGTGSEVPLAALAEAYAGNLGSLLIAATVIVSVLGNMTAGHTVGSRMTSSMADDRLIPAWFGDLSRWSTPANSILFFGAGAMLLALTGTFVTLAVAGTLGRLIVYIAAIASLPLLRRALGLAPLTTATAIAGPVALVLCVWASFQSSREQWLLIGAFLLVGTVLFLLARGQRIAWAARHG
jgi:amino acid transporter